MPAILRNIDATALPAASPFSVSIRCVLRALTRALDRLVPPRRGSEDEPPPEFFRYPPF